MNILIIGGTGFLGRYLVDAAQARNHILTLFNRGQSNTNLFPKLATIIGVYRSSTGNFPLRNSNTPGAPSLSFALRNAGDVGIAGDWNGDGTDTTAVFRPSSGVILLKNTNATGCADVALNYGLPGDQPVAGDWGDNRTTTIGIYRNAKFSTSISLQTS